MQLVDPAVAVVNRDLPDIRRVGDTQAPQVDVRFQGPQVAVECDI